MITVEHLSYEYPDTRALDDISFTVQEGAITALVGPNGAGKTTLLKCIAGLVKPYGGRISVDNINVLEEPRKSHEVMGFLTDFFGLYDALTVSQSLEYFALAQNLDKGTVRERAVEVAGLLNLSDKLHSPASSLSRGMRQRLAVGQAMVHYPKVLFLDEPSSGLDPEARISLAELFLRLNAEKNMTIIVSSHILAELDQYANELLVLRNGRIVEHSAVGEKTRNRRKILLRCDGGEERVADLVQEVQNMNMNKILRVSRDNEYIRLDFSGKDRDMSELLKKLVDAGLPVVEFFSKSEGMQEQYLETIRTVSRPSVQQPEEGGPSRDQ